MNHRHRIALKIDHRWGLKQGNWGKCWGDFLPQSSSCDLSQVWTWLQCTYNLLVKLCIFILIPQVYLIDCLTPWKNYLYYQGDEENVGEISCCKVLRVVTYHLPVAILQLLHLYIENFYFNPNSSDRMHLVYLTDWLLIRLHSCWCCRRHESYNFWTLITVH